jgi:flagellar hook-basal body complex protein FliE
MIKTYNQMQNTLKNYDMNGWAKNVELGNRINFRTGPLEGADEAKEAGSFGQMLAESMSKVNDMQHQANVAMEKLASGESNNLHETLLAVEKAEIAFKTMNQVRSKVLDAYREIMKMQV